MKKQRIIRNVLAAVLSVILAVVVPLSASAASGATPDYNSERGFRSITAYTGGGQGEGGGEESGTLAENGEQAAQNTELIVIKEVPTVDGGQATDWGGGNEGPDKLVDGYFGTKYGIGKYDRSDPEPWVEFHYEAPFTPVGYILRTAGDEEGKRNPVSWVIKARNNTTEEWTILDSKNNSGNEYLPMANNAETKFDIENNTAYQYYRFEATKRLNGPERQFQLAELQFYISGVSTLVYKNLTVTGGSAWGSVYGCGPENLVDNDKNTNSGYWLCNQAGDKSAPPGESGEYWWADFESTAPIEVQLYGLTASYIKGGNPKSWTIKAREKETDEWKVIETVTNESFPNQDSPTEWFVLDTPGTYQYFRLLISESTNDSRLLLREIELAYHYFPSGIRGDHGVGNHYPESYDSLVDGDPDTKWYCGPGAKSVPEGETGSFYWMDFHLDKLIEAEGYSLTTGYDNTLYPGRNPVSWILKAKGRADDHWVVIDTVNNDTTLTDEDKKTFNFNLDTPGTYRYFRLLISESRGSDGIQLSELKIKAGSGSGSGGSVETWEKKITGLGTGAIANPADGNLGWSYVYYGKYNGNPVKYRVLDKNSHDFGVENGSLFLDCDSILFRAAFYSGQPVTDWRDSELRSRLNGDAFLDKDGVFTGMEKDAIGESTKASKADGDGSYGASDIFSPLEADRIFLLDVVEAYRSSYGYSGAISNRSLYKENMNLGWWLRTYQRDGYGALIQEQVYGNGTVRMVHVLVNWGREGGIGPAFNLKRTSILSASLLSGTEGESGAEYKLTVFSNPDEMKIGVNEAIGANYVGNGMIAVPYTITGTNAADADQVSVLLLDHEYSPGETLTDTSRYDYGKLLMEDSFSVSGVGTISIPESYAGKTLGKDYYIYIFAEDIRDGRETDYATGLVKVTPQEESIFNDVFTSQPSDLTLPYGYGSGQTLSVGTKEPGAYNYSCQWYINGRKSYEVSTLLSGASGKSYEIPVGKTPVKEYYYCVVTVKQGGTTIAMVRSDIATLTVVKRGITLSGVIKAYDKVYDGTTDADIDYSQIQLEGLVNPGDVSVDITGRFESADAGENKRVIISDIILTGATSNYVVEDEAYQIFATASIRKAEVTGLQAPAAKTGLVFTGKAQELVLPGTAVGGKLNYAMSRNSGEPDASLYRETLPTAINSGNYYVWYKVVGDPNHNDTAPQSLFVDIVLIPSLEGGRVCAPAGAKLILAYYARPENVTEGALFMSAIKEVNIASDCAEADPAKLLNISRIPVRNCQLLLVDQRTGIPLCKAWKP